MSSLRGGDAVAPGLRRGFINFKWGVGTDIILFNSFHVPREKNVCSFRSTPSFLVTRLLCHHPFAFLVCCSLCNRSLWKGKRKKKIGQLYVKWIVCYKKLCKFVSSIFIISYFFPPTPSYCLFLHLCFHVSFPLTLLVVRE